MAILQIKEAIFTSYFTSHFSDPIDVTSSHVSQLCRGTLSFLVDARKQVKFVGTKLEPRNITNIFSESFLRLFFTSSTTVFELIYFRVEGMDARASQT